MSPLLLGIESSCDETAAAVVEGDRHVRSNIVSTQHELHVEYAGVVPEIASRAHLERIGPVIETALREAGVALSDIDGVAVGHEPGLIGSLLVGVSAAKALAWSIDRPLLAVNHVLAHLHSPALDTEPITFPAIGLVVSGGHTSLYHLDDALSVRELGRTIDDAVGEAYDKAAVLLGLGWPGGPALDRLAGEGDEQAVDLPVSMLDRESLDFSYSGLKTALLYAVRGHPTGRGAAAAFPRRTEDLTDDRRRDLAASFQRAAVTSIVRKIERALSTHEVSSLLVGGGVSANSRLRRDLESFCRDRDLQLRLPAPHYCMDNAAMIAGLGAVQLEAGQVADLTLSASARST
ncbi:MAG: tRNA (adenosine(37)-N6)-threonylcarbamoyltransferase complex transferase subunit TsaD [Phycisphaerales bacterium]|nr:tRNA (adenosine(37)-N6)-threonylcarbamoyltransferase complex transferase subunit TsaD [Phycisphaerales bacterium]